MMAIMLAVQFLLFRPFAGKADEWTYTEFKQAVAAGSVQQVEIGENLIEGVTADETNFTVIRSRIRPCWMT
jgi:hypothetical protein